MANPITKDTLKPDYMSDYDLVMNLSECREFITGLRVELRCKPINVAAMMNALNNLLTVKGILTKELEERNIAARQLPNMNNKLRNY